jgi:tetratricopeptide (TPR) repeat protein
LLQHWWAYLDWIFPAGVAATAVLLSRRAPYIGLGLTISLFALLPVLGLVPFVYQDYSTTADRYMYIAMLGPALILATMLADLTASIKRPIYCLVSLWLAALSFLSFRQSLVWRNSQALYTNAVSVNPRSGVSQNGLGNELENQHIYGQAAAHYFIATEDAPTNALFRVNLGQEYFLLGDLKDAEREYRTTILDAPGLARAHRDLGILLLCENKTNEGIAELKTAVRLNPRDESATRLISEQEKALDR